MFRFKTFLFLFSLILFSQPSFGQKIESGTAISVSIRGVPAGEQGQVNGTYTVSNKGYITMPFVGQVKAAGYSNAQLENKIAAAYRNAQIYTSPTIVVLSNSSDAQRQLTVTVGGFVRRPGPVNYRQGMTLYDVIQQAGGRDTFGSRTVKLFRGNKVADYDLSKDRHKMVKVYPNDTIEVPQIGAFERR